jgi:hypothetical protein
MFRSWWVRAIAVAVPGLLLAGFGLVHPAGLHAGDAQWWVRLHVLLLPVLPLLGVAQWILLASAPGPLRWLGRLAAYGYATFYTGLDAVAGIAAGTVEHASGGVSPLTGRLFEVGDMLGYVGAWCFLAGNVCLVAGVARLTGWRAAPGAVLLLVASVSFLDSHLFWPRGVFTMLAIGVGMLLLSAAQSAPWLTTMAPPRLSPLLGQTGRRRRGTR